MRWTRPTLIITEAFVALSAFVAGAMFVAAVPGQNPIGVPVLADGDERAGAIALNHPCLRPTWGIIM
jgi:hypothetical protein